MLPEQGVGVTYSSGLDPLIRDNPTLFHVLEIEPQTFWLETPNGARPFRVLGELFERIAGLPGKKLVHSVGAPVGGTIPPDASQFALLREAISILNADYASEHLSFNSTHGFNTGFFLPPRQTTEGVARATASISRLRDAIQVPLAVETGVNYFKRRSDEIPDGEFFRAVAESADCGILLDLHNLYANEINGRQPVEEFLAAIPLERVWEVHLAGGMVRDGYYLDSHSGAVEDKLFDLSKRIIARLPNLKTIIFELFPSFLPLTGLELVKREVERLHELWAVRGTAQVAPRDRPAVRVEGTERPFLPEEWELSVGKLAVGGSADSALFGELARDPAVPVVQKLIQEFRGSMLVGVLPLSCRLMILTLTEEIFMAVLRDFWARRTPKQYASSEAMEFAAYLRELNLKVPSLAKVLEYETAVINTLADDVTRVVAFDFNPFPLLESLAEGKLPQRESELGSYEIEITPEVYTHLSENGNYGVSAFPYH
jgi:uncharacterized protein (UPF0276 family)